MSVPAHLHVVDGIARRQLGLLTATQLTEAGVSTDARRELARHGYLVAVRRGVYRVAGAPESWSTTVLGALLAAGPSAVASHGTAARLWGVTAELGRLDPDERDRMQAIHITSSSQVRLPGAIGHRVDLPADERTVVHRIAVTALERTLLDLAGDLGPVALGRCVDEALRRGASLDRLRMLAERHVGGGRARRWPLTVVLGERLPGFDPGANDWERRMDNLWDTLGLPAAQRQYPVLVGGRCYVLDRAIPELLIGVEWNGFAYHGRRSRFDHDSYRRADLLAAGWELIEVTSKWSPERVRRVVQAVVDRRRGGSAPGAGDGPTPLYISKR